MIGLKEAAGLIASAILLVSSLVVPPGDHGTVALESLDGDGTRATAESPVPLNLDEVHVYDAISSDGTTVPPATLTGTIDRFTAVAATTETATALSFGDQRLEVVPGAKITVEGLSGTVDLVPRPGGAGLAIDGTATDVTIKPPTQPTVSTETGGQDGIEVASLALEGRAVRPGFQDAGSFDRLTFMPAERDEAPPQLRVGGQVLPLEAGQGVQIGDYVGVVAFVRVSEDNAHLRLEGHGNVTIAGTEIDESVSPSVDQSVPKVTPSDPPSASFTFAPETPETGETVSFTDGSEDDVAVTDWQWTFDDGETSQAQHPEHSFPGPGTYEVTLTVTDAEGQQTSTTQPVTVVNSRPHVHLSWEPLTPIELEDVAFTANVTDQDGDVTSVDWTFSDGETAEGREITRVFDTEGTYNVTVIATDSEGATDSDEAQIHVVNAPPEASFEVSPTTPVAGTLATLTSTSSDPAGGSIENWTWQIPGVGTTYGETVDVRFPSDGETTVTLTVRDDDGASSDVEQTVSVLNAPPDVSIDIDPVYPNPGQTVEFIAQIDDDDQPAWAEWSFSDGLFEEGLSVERTFANPGSIEATVTVEDADGAQGTATRTVNINAPPVVELGVVGEGDDISETAMLTGQEITFELSVSDPDGNATTHTWVVGTVEDLEATNCQASGPDGHTLTCSWSDDGTRRIQALVDDDNGARSVKTTHVIVLNQKPTLSPHVEEDVVNVGEDATFAANAQDPDGEIASVTWHEDGQLLGTGQQLVHAFDEAGEHTLTVNATDDDGASQTATVQIEVNAPPTLDASVSPTETLTGESVSFDADGDDPDGPDSSLTYQWTFGDGYSDDQASTTHAYTEAGEYTVQVTVEDDAGASTSETFTVDVNVPDLDPEIVASPQAPQAGTEVTLTVEYEGDRDVESVTWDLDDGTTQTTDDATLTYSFPDPRNYQVTATLETDDGAEADAVTHLRVTGSFEHTISLTPQLPDGQCPNLDAQVVDVNYTHLRTGDLIGLDTNPTSWTLVGACTLETTVAPGEWSIGDGFKITGRIADARTTLQSDFSSTGSVTLGEVELRTPLELRNVHVEASSREPIVLDGSDQSITYHDPLEPVHVRGELVWAEGTPAHTYGIDLTATYNGPQDILGTYGIDYREWTEPTEDDGTFKILVPAPVLGASPSEPSFTEPDDGGFLYLPGRYDVRVVASSDFMSDVERVTFVEDPEGIFAALEDTGLQP